jgi:putative transposase
LLEEIRKIHQDSQQAYGAITSWQAVCQAEIEGGNHRLARLRRRAGIEARRKWKFCLAYQSRNNVPAVANLFNWPFEVTHPDQI